MTTAIVRKREPDVGGPSPEADFPALCLPAYFHGRVPMGASLPFWNSVAVARVSYGLAAEEILQRQPIESYMLGIPRARARN